MPQDDPLAFKWMKAAAERNHVSAQFNLAQMYLAGRGVALDVAAAKIWLQKAASRGNDDARKLLAEIPAQRRIEPGAPNSPQVSPQGASRAPAKPGASSQPGLANIPRNERAEMLEAAGRGQTDALKKLIASGASIAAKDDDGNTALVLAASAGKIDAVKMLLAARADVNAGNKLDERPLMFAAAGGYADIVENLLGQGADIAARNHDGDNALTLATRGCHEQVVRALIDHGADIRVALDHGTTPLMLAAAACPLNLMELLIAKGAQVDGVRRQGQDRIMVCGRLRKCRRAAGAAETQG